MIQRDATTEYSHPWGFYQILWLKSARRWTKLAMRFPVVTEPMAAAANARELVFTTYSPLPCGLWTRQVRTKTPDNPWRTDRDITGPRGERELMMRWVEGDYEWVWAQMLELHNKPWKEIE